MTNPKDPQVFRRLGGPIVPLGADGEPDRGLPVERLRRVGATDDVVGYLQEVWDSLDGDDRAGWLAELDVMTDAELADELSDVAVDDLPDPADAAETFFTGESGTQIPTVDEATGEPLPPAIEGRVEHEGGGWYSVWVDGVKVTGDDNVRGRDAAQQLLDDELADRFGPIDGG